MALSDYGVFLESAPDAMVVVTLDGAIVLLNRQAEALFGYDPAQLVGQPVEELVPTRFRADHASHRGRFAESPSTRPMGAGLELYGRRRDGTDFPVEISLSPLRIDGQDYIASAIRDITERRRVEEKLAHAQAELERRRARERQAVEINDEIVQGLVVAKYALDERAEAKTREAVEDTLQRARDIVTELLSGAGERLDLTPGDLRRGALAARAEAEPPEEGAA